MNLLPDTDKIPNEVVIQRIHRNAYDHALRTAGAKLIEAGHIGHPTGGYTEPWHIETAINERTVAVHWVAMPVEGAVSLEDTVAVAHKHNVPVIVDAAGGLPPAENLQGYIATGADLVSFSGGKAIQGPQASGILVGRSDLIQSVALQHQDMDVMVETWTLREQLLGSGRLLGPPLQGIGRPMKVGKEEIAGLLAAVKKYVSRDHAAARVEWLRRLDAIGAELSDVAGVSSEVVGRDGASYPTLRVSLDDVGARRNGHRSGQPLIRRRSGHCRQPVRIARRQRSDQSAQPGWRQTATRGPTHPRGRYFVRFTL